MKQIFILITSIFFLTGCGGSGGSSSESNQDVEMVISEVYTVYPGNKVIKNSENALVNIAHTDGQEESAIVLLEGNATIIRNP